MRRTLTVVISRWALLAVPATMLGILAVTFFLVASGKQTTRNMSSDNSAELSEKKEITDPTAEETPKVSTEVSDQFEENIKQASVRYTAQENLKAVTLALLNYNDTWIRLPIFAIGLQGEPVKGFQDKPLLSWRVALLPYLGEDKLFKEFCLDEPWDSEHNKKLIPRMPKLFQSQTKANKDGFTHLQMVIGPNAMQPNNRIGSIVDGTANTVAVVEAAEPVIWTKPADVMLAAQETPQKDFRAKFGGQFTGGFFVSMWDGSIHFVEDSVSDRTLADAINPADGKELGSDWKPKSKKSETIEFGNENGIPVLSLRAEPNELYNWAQLSGDGNRVFAGVGDRIRAWDARTGISICNIELTAGGVVTSCNDGGTYAVSLAGNKAVIWELNLSKASAKRLLELKDYPATSAQISPDGTRVVTFTRGAEKQTARVWDAMTGKPLMELKNKGAVVSAEFHSEGNLIATTCLFKDGKIGDGPSSDYLKPWSTLWDSKLGNKICDAGREFKAIDRRKNLLLSISSGNIELVRLLDNGVVHEFKSDRERITVSRAVINSHANRIVTAGEFLDETARVWSLDSPDQLFALKHGDAVEFVDISPTGDHILTAGPTIIRIWSLKPGKATDEPTNQRKKMASEPAEEPTKLIREPAGRSNGLLGGWKITSAQRNGKNEPENEGPTAVYFTKDTMYFGTLGLMFPFNYRLDESAKPAYLNIDFVPEKVLAILERDGDTLKICMDKSRPVRFESITGSSATLLTLKRDASAEEPKVDRKAMESALGRVKMAAKRFLSSNNLKQIGLALLNYESAYRKYPKAAITDKTGQPLLSWRVAILPFIDQEELYKQFKLDEPWDSNHNKKLLAKMPKQFGEMGTETAYRAFTGKGTMFEQAGGVEISSIRDGTSNTALVIETPDMVSWTKPDEVPYDPSKPLPKFGEKPFQGGFHVLFADGSVRFLSSKTSDETIRGIITRDGSEFLPDLDR